MEPCTAADADFLIRGKPRRCTIAMDFHLARHMAAWRCDVRLAHAASWDELEHQLDVRFPPSVWAIAHWDVSDRLNRKDYGEAQPVLAVHDAQSLHTMESHIALQGVCGDERERQGLLPGV